MASETVKPIDWSQPPLSWAVPPELHVLHGVNASYNLQDLLEQLGLKHAPMGMPGQHTTSVATQGIPSGIRCAARTQGTQAEHQCCYSPLHSHYQRTFNEINVSIKLRLTGIQNY